jgi:hypothetical protein
LTKSQKRSHRKRIKNRQLKVGFEPERS